MKSINIFSLHLGGSNGSKIELNTIFTPPYNAARYGITLTSSPRRADVVLLSGTLTAKLAGPAFDLLQTLPAHSRLILLGSDATSGMPFGRAYAVYGPLLEAEANSAASEPGTSGPQLTASGLTLPPGRKIAGRVTGSPPDPQAIIEAIISVGVKSQ